MLPLNSWMTVAYLIPGHKAFLHRKTAATSPTYSLTAAIKNIAAHQGTAKYSMA